MPELRRASTLTSTAAAAGRLLAGATLRSTLGVAGGVLAVALAAGAVRVLPLLLAPEVPARLAAPLARGALGMGLEAALVLAPPIGWAIAAARLLSRGEARALFALGASPLRLVGATWPALTAVALGAAGAAFAWGREATAPGRLVRDLVAEARHACVASAPAPGSSDAPAVADVPVLGVSWICFSGEPPRAAGALPLGARRGAFLASDLAIADDLRSVRLRDLALVATIGASENGPDERPSPGPPEPAAASPSSSSTEPDPTFGAREGERHVRVAAREAVIRNLAPIGRPSALSAAGRAAVVGASACASAFAAAIAVLRRRVENRAGAGAIGAVGPAAALVVLGSLERAPRSAIELALVPLAALAAVALAALCARALEVRR